MAFFVELPREQGFQPGSPVLGGHFGQKAHLSEIDAQQGNGQIRQGARRAQHGPVAAEHQGGVGVSARFGQGVAVPARGYADRIHAARPQPQAHGLAGLPGGGVVFLDD